MGWVLIGFVWLAVGVFLTAYLSGKYEWDACKDNSVFWLYLGSTIIWPVALALWFLIIPAAKIHQWSKPKEKK